MALITREEGAIHFASQVISDGWRRVLRLRGFELLRIVRDGRCSSANGENAAPNTPSPSFGVDSPFVAVMPEASSLRGVLGGFLYVGMRTSCKRVQEENNRLTSAVCLHFAAYHGGDFKLELFVNAMTGIAIAQANGDDGLVRDMLGDYLTDAMEGSLWMQEEERVGRSGTTKAFGVIPVETTDYRLSILLRFSTGTELFNQLFPN